MTNLASYWLPGLFFSLMTMPAMAQPGNYPKPVVDKLMQDCVKTLSASQPANVVNARCQCAVTQIQARVPLTDYENLINALDTQKPLTAKQNNDLAVMTQSAQSCKPEQ